MFRNRVFLVAIACLVILLMAGIVSAANPSSGTTTTDQTLSISIDDPADGSFVDVPPGTVDVSGTVTLTLLSSNIVYVVDASGSTQSGGALAGQGGQDCNGNGVAGDAGDDINGNGWVGSTLDCEISGVIALNDSLSGVAGARAGIVMFSTNATVADVDPASGQQNTTSPLEVDKNTNGMADIEDVARSMHIEQPAKVSVVQEFTRKEFSSSGTNFDAALTKLNEALSGISGGIAYFLSDGEPEPPDAFSTGAGSPLASTVAAGTIVNTYSIGSAGAGCSAASALRIIADQTGGTCTEVPDPTDLRDVLKAGTQFDQVQVRLNGGSPVQATLDPTGSIRNWTVSLSNVQCGNNTIAATVTTTDNTRVTADINVFGQCDADLSINKTASPDPVNAGADLTYTLTVANAGPVSASDVTVTDTLPDGAGFVSASGTGWTCNESSGVVTCTTGTVDVGTAPDITITVTAPAGGGDITNTAVVDASTPDPNPDNNTTTTTTTVVPVADLVITKTVDADQTGVGAQLTYTLTVDNAGPSDAMDVSVTDTLPAGATLVSAEGDGWTCNAAGDTVTCTRPSISAGAQHAITVVITTPDADADMDLANTATVDSSTTDPDPSNNTSTVTTRLIVPPRGTDKLTAQVYIDYACDRYFQYGLDVALANVPVTVTFHANGASQTLYSLATGWVYFAGIDASGGLTVSADLPSDFAGYALGQCLDSSATVELDPSDFDGGTIRHKHVEFRTQVLGEMAAR